MGENREKTKETRLRVVIDTSALIPALLSSKGYAFEVFELLFEGEIINYYSTSTKAEHYDVLNYPKLLKRIPFEVSKKRVDVVIFYSKKAQIKRSFKKSKTLLEKVRDPKDIPFLDVVYNAKADVLITYDRKHLLRIRDKEKKFKLGRHEFYILTPKEFIKLYKEKRN